MNRFFFHTIRNGAYMWQKILTELSWFIGVLASALLGFAIGYERKLRSKEAGIGTHTIICIGAALMMVVSKHGFSGESDSSRVAAQIVSGIGFLGAGIIVYRQHEIHGLTTAAGMWATAGVGMAAGAGLFAVALAATLLIIVVQCLYHLPLRLFRHKRFYRLRVVFWHHEGETDEIKKIFGCSRFQSLEMVRQKEGVCCFATLFTAEEFSFAKLNDIMRTHPYIQSIQREDET